MLAEQKHLKDHIRHLKGFGLYTKVVECHYKSLKRGVNNQTFIKYKLGGIAEIGLEEDKTAAGKLVRWLKQSSRLEMMVA